ncbi:MAG: STN domain-containing protein [Gemmataceae bacterium]|nr:STN domain-containing protein [Gemmataceae bacterium]
MSLRNLPLLVVLIVPAASFADDLKDIVERDNIAVQKLKTDVNFALSQAKAFEKSDPERAKSLLEKALSQVNNSRELSDDDRTLLRRRVQTRIQEVSQIVRVRQLADEEETKRLADKTKRDKPPAGPTLTETANKTIGNAAQNLAAAQRLRDVQRQRYTGIMGQLQESAMQIEGGVEYPKYWKQLTENRAKIVGNRLNDKEIALLKALNSVMTIDFNKAKLREVFDYISEKTGQPIVVEEGSLKEAGVDYDEEVSLRLNKVTVRTILRKILNDRQLTYVLREGVITVVTHQRAREMMVVRTYPIEDLVGPISNVWGPFVNRAIMLQNVAQLVQNIQGTVQPGLWAANGGGAITFHEPSMALVIRAPAEFHYMFGSGGLLGR